MASDTELRGQPCSDWLHRLPDEPAAPVVMAPAPRIAREKLELIFVPGLFGECFDDRVSVLEDARRHLSALGYGVQVAATRGRASSEFNAQVVADLVEATSHRRPGSKIVLIGYSKGTVDALVALHDRPAAAKHVAALLSVAGAINGSPLADGLVDLYEQTFGQLTFARCPIVDHGELRSLTRPERLNWLAAHTLPAGIGYYSLVALPSADRVSQVLQPWYARLSQLDPRNDGQVLLQDAVVPGSRVLGYVNADHWGVALPFALRSPMLARTLASPNEFPRMQLIEAAMQLIAADLK